MLALAIADDSVGAITACHAVFHVRRDDHPTVYREFARVPHPNGKDLLTVGSSASEQVRSNWLDSGRPMFFSTPGVDGTASQLENVGFEIVWQRRVEDALGSTVPFVLAQFHPEPSGVVPRSRGTESPLAVKHRGTKGREAPACDTTEPTGSTDTNVSPKISVSDDYQIV